MFQIQKLNEEVRAWGEVVAAWEVVETYDDLRLALESLWKHTRDGGGEVYIAILYDFAIYGSDLSKWEGAIKWNDPL